MGMRRREWLKALGVLGCAALPGRILPAFAAPESAPGADYCSANGSSGPLFVPSRLGWFGRLAPDGEAITMRAEDILGGTGTWTQGLIVQHRRRRYVNPTLVLKPGERVRIDLENGSHEPTLLH